jgi:hypothetical protein
LVFAARRKLPSLLAACISYLSKRYACTDPVGQELEYQTTKAGRPLSCMDVVPAEVVKMMLAAVGKHLGERARASGVHLGDDAPKEPKESP